MGDVVESKYINTLGTTKEIKKNRVIQISIFFTLSLLYSPPHIGTVPDITTLIKYSVHFLLLNNIAETPFHVTATKKTMIVRRYLPVTKLEHYSSKKDCCTY